MKLSPHLADIERTFMALTQAGDTASSEEMVPSASHGRRIRRDLPIDRSLASVPRLIQTYQSHTITNTTENKQLLLQLAALEATYHNHPTPISPDMFPLVINTGASVTVTPCATNFITPIKPVQAVEIKGIAAGLQVHGYGNV
jgi:hypothetical protein